MTNLAFIDITLDEFDALRQQPNTAVVDVRDAWEFEEFNLGGLNVPLPDIRSRKAELLPYDTLIVLCTNGVRSRIAAKDLRRQPEFGATAIYHLHGGLIGEE